MHHKIIKFIHELKVFFLLFIVFSFMFQLGVSPIDFGKFIGAEFSQAVSFKTSASVPANPINTLALELREKEQALNLREQSINEKENSLVSDYFSQKNLLLFVAVGIFILLILILINFYFDIKNRKNKFLGHASN